MDKFQLVSDYKPTGDQPEAIKKLTDGVNNGMRKQTLLGVTGSGKTFTMANVIANVNKPTLVLAHNKTLAAQLCNELREFFPNNAVEYFVSYYDYYQPEAYVPGKDIYIEKDAMINDEIDKLRHSATSALFERRDVIIVSSVSCIFSLGNPEDYHNLMISLRPGMIMERDTLLRKLISINYTRNDIEFDRNTFRVMGDTVDIFPSSSDGKIIRVEFFDDEIDRITEIARLTGECIRDLRYASIFPTTHYATTDDKKYEAIKEIQQELAERVKWFKENDKLVEAQRIAQRTNYDIEMIQEIGYCSGVENYSRVFSGRPAGSTPYTLLDYFPKDYLLFIDESHTTVPQIRAMSGGDKARKTNLVEYGFRLPSAYDNRPLHYDEFEKKTNQVIYVSATPSEYELSSSEQIAEQIIRPTGLIDPSVEIRPLTSQVDDLMLEIRARAKKNEKVLATTLTTKMAENLTEYLCTNGIKAKYIHHNVDTLDRVKIIQGLRAGEFDALVGINLLREGLDIPEVSLVAILDADKEGLFHSETSLIQTIGRAARNVNGKVIMYADSITHSMKTAIGETNRRRKIQEKYNTDNGIIPKSIVKDIPKLIDVSDKTDNKVPRKGKNTEKIPLSEKDFNSMIEKLTKEMKDAAKRLEFEQAAFLRDRITELKQKREKDVT